MAHSISPPQQFLELWTPSNPDLCYSCQKVPKSGQSGLYCSKRYKRREAKARRWERDPERPMPDAIRERLSAQQTEAPAPAPLIQEQMKPTISNLRQRTLGECVLWAKEIKRKRATEEIEERRERPSANAVNATRRKWIVPRLVCCEDREDFEYKGELDGHNDPEDESGWEDVSGNESGSGDEDDGSEDEDGSQDDDGSDDEDGSEEDESDWYDGDSEALRRACTCAYERSGICKAHKRLLNEFKRMNDDVWGGSGTFQSDCGYPDLVGLGWEYNYS